MTMIKPFKAKAHINGIGDVVGIIDAEKPTRSMKSKGKLYRFKPEGGRARWISDATVWAI